MKISIMAALAALVLAGCTTSPEMPAFRKMLVVGDALTACAPDASLGWPNDWGMAATARENDFAHRLHAALRKASPDLELATDSIMYQDEMTGWVHLVPCSADLVVIQLGENYKGGISLDEYGEDGDSFVTADVENGWAAVVFNDWNEDGTPYMYQPVSQEGGAEEAPVCIGGQTPVAMRNALHDIALAAKCLRYFALTGERYPGLEWEQTA